jgi:hypothetical protein
MSLYDLNTASLNAYLAGKHAARRDYWAQQAAKNDRDREACEAFAQAADAAHHAALERAVKSQRLAAVQTELRFLQVQS